MHPKHRPFPVPCLFMIIVVLSISFHCFSLTCYFFLLQSERRLQKIPPLRSQVRSSFTASLCIIAFNAYRAQPSMPCVTFSISLESPNHLCPRPPLHSPPPIHSTSQLTMLRLKTEKLLSTTPAPERWTGTARLSLNIIINMPCALSERLLK
jgi:hypothetical protein